MSALLLLGALFASAAPISPRLLHPKQQGPVRAAIRFEERIGDRALAAIRRAGARPVELPVGGFAVVGRVVSADVLQGDLQKVARVPGVVRIDPVIPPIRVRPLDVTARKTGAPLAWSPPERDDRFAGRGVVVADHEGGWNIFHPDFFFPDGGLYDFEDRNGDGKAGAGDGVDLDGDGVFESTLSLLDGVTEDIYTGERIHTAGYQPDVDWLYVNVNGDFVRNAGYDFAEDTPGLGEPIFVGDDVDRSGTIDRYERLVRLGSSKIRAVVFEGATYERGVNLAQYPSYAFDASHGTGAVGIVSAGAIGLRRYVGIAPEAELVLVTDPDPIVGLAAAMQLGAHISFYEWSSPADLQDGSGPFETAISDAAAEGMVQLAAAGNLANADHVMELRDLNGTRRVDFTTDDLDTYAYRTFWLNVHWDGPLSAVNLSLLGSSSGSIDIAGPFTDGIVDGIEIAAWAEETAHGNGSVLIVGHADGARLPETVLSLRVSTTANVPRIRGVLFDDQSGWAKGISWLSDRTDAGSALMPSTADTVIAVAAYGGRRDLEPIGWGAIDERRRYSGMGPRIDGAPIIDISAPDDPFSPAWRSDPTVLYASFGGTSGALPHAAGAAAVLLSSGVPFSHAAVEALLTESARTDEHTGQVPNEAYGYGKVDLGRALFGASYEASPSPMILLSGPSPAVVGRNAVIVAEISQPGGSVDDVLVAWDLDYDGIEEEPLNASLRFSTVPKETGTLRVVGRAKNMITGKTARALFVAEVVEDCAISGCASGCCRSDGLCAECPPPQDAGAMDASRDADVEIRTTDRTSSCGCSAAHSNGRTGVALLLLVSGILLRRARARSLRS